MQKMAGFSQFVLDIILFPTCWTETQLGIDLQMFMNMGKERIFQGEYLGHHLQPIR